MTLKEALETKQPYRMVGRHLWWARWDEDMIFSLDEVLGAWEVAPKGYFV